MQRQPSTYSSRLYSCPRATRLQLSSRRITETLASHQLRAAHRHSYSLPVLLLLLLLLLVEVQGRRLVAAAMSSSALTRNNRSSAARITSSPSTR